MSDPDAIGPDGTVRLRCYARHPNSIWFAAGCPDCGRPAPIGVRPAIAIMGSGEASVGQLGRRVQIHIAADTRPPEVRNREGPLPQTRGDPRRQG
jgi:hypothetical protein